MADEKRNETVDISVIVPVFNAEAYLQRCIDSILCSRYEKFELILVDDGSVDGSCIICEQYEKKDRRVRLIKQKHQGVSAARNRGIFASCGKWVVFVDSDDFISNDFLSLIMRKEYEEQELLIFDYAGSNEWGVYPDRKKHLHGQIAERRYTEKENLLLVEKMLRHCQLMKDGHTDMRSVCAKAYKRAVIQQYFLRFPAGLAIGEDQIFQIRCQMKVSCCIYIKKAVYYVEAHSDSATRRYHPDTWKQYLRFIRYLKHILESYPDFPVWREAYYDAVLSNLKGMLAMGIFHPQNTDPVRKKYQLCHEIRRLPVIEHAVKFWNKNTDDWTRKVLILFFRLRCYPIVEILCRIGHIRMKWKKR